MARKWTQEELSDLKDLYPTTAAEDVIRILNERYGSNRTLSGIYTIVNKYGWKKRTVPFWNEERKAFMREFVPGRCEQEIADAFEDRFGIRLTRTQVKNGKAVCGVKSGTFGGRFEKGAEPMNKGKTWKEFMPPESQERCRRTQFQKGNLPHNAQDKPIGYERVDRDGYTWVKVAERKSKPDCNDNFRMKHHIVWEQAHGCQIPPSTMIVFANHDKQDFNPENLVAVPRSIWALISRNHYEYHDAASLGVCMNLARLKSGIASAKNAPRTCRKCGTVFNPRYPHQRTCDVCLGRKEG